MKNTYTVRAQFFGKVPVHFVADVLAAAEKQWPGAVALTSDHDLSKATGATLTVATEVET